IKHDGVKVILDPQNNRTGGVTVFVSHGHFDHSTAFKIKNVTKYSSKETADLMSSFGVQVENWQPLTAGKKVAIDDVEVIPHNSGHVLGSYEFEVATPEGNVLFTGDFNTVQTKTMQPAEPVQCDVLILESTFGSPSFVFPSEDLVGKEMVDWAKKTMKAGGIPTFQTDPLGNAQEIIGIFNESAIPVVTHWKVTRINRIYEVHGHRLKYLDTKSDEAQEIIQSGNFVYITPKQLKLQDKPEFVPALVSGWALWSKRTAFPLSDHADFPHLVKFVEDCKPKTVLTCHGSRFTETLARYIEKKLGIRSYPINLIPTTLQSKTAKWQIQAILK
ncbi:MAG: MBL fold metallo-hydrolase, partial [Candidatus Bathyarchaeota archaeon]|nr:MBL fold metallo-hydrolase [Candidatus Bathyarchaeota archaeon]